MGTGCEILRYPAIVLIDILGTKPRAWTADPSNALNELRMVSVEARVIEYLKGSGPRGDVTFVVTQRHPANNWPAEDYGPWSGVALEARPRLLAFLTSAAPATARVFGSDDNFVIAAVGDRFNPKALDEVQVALRLSGRDDFPGMLKGGNIDPEIAPHLPDAGFLLANFVLDTADIQTLEALLGAPQASPLFRQVLLTHRMDQLTIADGSAAERARLARIMLKILGELGEQARPLQWVVAQTHLRNVIFDASAHARITSTQVFADIMDSLLLTHPFSDDVRLLISDWARRK